MRHRTFSKGHVCPRALASSLPFVLPLALLVASGCEPVDDSSDSPEEPFGVAAAAAEEENTTLACEWGPYTGYSSWDVVFGIDTSLDSLPANANMDEKCRLRRGWVTFSGMAGRQIRVTANGRSSLCTVDTGYHDLPWPNDSKVLLSTESFKKRFGSSATSPVTGLWTTYPLSPINTCGWVAEPLSSITSTPNSAFGLGDFHSAPASSPASRLVAFTAPHGGGIETGTGEQLQYLHTLHGSAAHFWLVRGMGTEQHDRWHITSDDVSHMSFHGLHKLREAFIAATGPQVRKQVVGFHGYVPRTGCNEDVLIGGDAPLVLRQGIASAVALWTDYRGVTISTRADFANAPANCPRGANDANYVNELSENGEGIHIEQAAAVKDNVSRRKALAEAVARYVLAYNETQLNPALGARALGAASSTDAGLGATWTVPSNTRVGSGGVYGTCGSADDRGHVDWFVRSGNNLLRVGGGALVCDANNRLVPGAGFQAVSYLNSSGSSVKARVVGVAYTRNDSSASLRMEATLSQI